MRCTELPIPSLRALSLSKGCSSWGFDKLSPRGSPAGVRFFGLCRRVQSSELSGTGDGRSAEEVTTTAAPRSADRSSDCITSRT